MANPSAAHEPSMEEILASIRQIISEDEEGPSGAKAALGQGQASTSASVAPESEPAPYETVVSRLESETKPESKQPPPPVPESKQPPPPVPESRPAAPPALASSKPAVAQGADAEAKSPPAVRSQPSTAAENALLSPDKSAAVSGAFGALTQTLLAQNSRTLEEVVSEMLQPMLKSWLDDNLPSLVERMVQEEIERVSRGRR